jgi:hypothetical protein
MIVATFGKFFFAVAESTPSRFILAGGGDRLDSELATRFIPNCEPFLPNSTALILAFTSKIARTHHDRQSKTTLRCRLP